MLSGYLPYPYKSMTQNFIIHVLIWLILAISNRAAYELCIDQKTAISWSRSCSY